MQLQHCSFNIRQLAPCWQRFGVAGCCAGALTREPADSVGITLFIIRDFVCVIMNAGLCSSNIVSQCTR